MFNNMQRKPLETMNVSVEAIATSLAEQIEANKNSDPFIQACQNKMAVNSYRNQSFAKLADSTWWLANAMLSNQQYSQYQPQQVINEAMQRMVYAVGADTLASMPMVIRGQDQQTQIRCQQIIADIPNLHGFIEQYKASCGGFNGSNGFSQPAQNNTGGFTGGNAWMNSAPSTSGFNQQTTTTQNTFGFSDFGSFSNSAVNAHAAEPAKAPFTPFNGRSDGSCATVQPTQSVQQTTTVPGGAKAPSTTEGTSVSILGINDMDYANHRLYYPGANVDSNVKPGAKADFFGILAAAIPVTPKERELPTDGRDLEALREEHIVKFPGDDGVFFAFGQSHAVAMMTAKLIKAVGVDLYYQSYLMDYYDVTVRHVYDSETTLGILLQDDVIKQVLDDELIMDLSELAAAIRLIHDSSSPINRAIATAMNIAATKAVNTLVYTDVGLKSVGLSVIDSFASDFDELVVFLTEKYGKEVVDNLFFNDGSVGLELASRLRNLVACPSLDMLSQISAYLKVDEHELAGRALYSVDRRLLLGIPHVVYDLGISCKSGANNVNPMETPALYKALQHAAAMLDPIDMAEMTSFHILTSDQVRFEVLYNRALTEFSLVQQ